MHRKPVLELLERYLSRNPDERVRVDHVRQFVRANPDCFERACVDGHITASAWIVSRDGASFLLTHHAKLGRWLQLGGHADGETDLVSVALREAREESGLSGFAVVSPEDDALPFDVDVHAIPARSAEPAHLHYDIRYLLSVSPEQALEISSESLDLRWFDRERASELLDSESLLRLARKADVLLRDRSLS